MNTIDFDSCVIDNRQRINLSEEAQFTIISDLLDFEGEKPSLSRAVNKVFLVYCDLAQHDSETISHYTSLKPKSFLKKIPRLQNRTVKVLEEQLALINDSYAGSLGSYLKSVIEQYASLSYSERVRAYFAKTIHDLEMAIRNKERVVIRTSSGKFSVRPYRIDTDKLTAHNYLIGYSKTAETDEAMCTFRLSRILEVINRGEEGGLTDKEIVEIQEAIQKRGVPFLASEPCLIRIRMNESGQRAYSRVIHNRPMYETKEDDVYSFICTEAQAEYYFFKFGADAEVLEPLSLRERFSALYKEAAFLYSC